MLEEQLSNRSEPEVSSEEKRRNSEYLSDFIKRCNAEYMPTIDYHLRKAKDTVVHSCLGAGIVGLGFIGDSGLIALMGAGVIGISAILGCYHVKKSNDVDKRLGKEIFTCIDTIRRRPFKE